MPPKPRKTFCKWLFVLAFVQIPLLGFCQLSVPQWVNDIGGPGSSSIPAGVRVDKQNNIYVTGIYSGTVDFDPSPTGVYNLTSINNTYDTYLAKYTSAGKLLWAVSVGGGGS